MSMKRSSEEERTSSKYKKNLQNIETYTTVLYRGFLLPEEVAKVLVQKVRPQPP
jgi:NADH:ubiquinone oxidoreductase subunit 6 (subunit J)